MNPRDPRLKHVLIQTVVSLLINGVLSLVFGLLVLHGRSAAPLEGQGGVAPDFFPQVFMVTFATVTAVTLATRASLRRGAFAPSGFAAKLLLGAAHPVVRGLVMALGATLALAPICWLGLRAAGVAELSASTFLELKVALGLALSLLIAPLIAAGA